MNDLLQNREQERLRRNEMARVAVLKKLRTVLREVWPGHEVFVFGSAIRPGEFTSVSDVDLGILAESPAMPRERLIGILSEALGRDVDVCVISVCRFGSKILGEGQRWTT